MTWLSVLLRPKVLVAAAGLVAGAVLVVLYVILSAPVHAPPLSLARLKPLEEVKPVPSVAFADAQGARHMLAEFKGRYVLLNLWATWCAPCIRELPALSRLQKAIGPDKLAVVAVNVGRSNAAETASFLKAHHAEGLAVYVDSNLALMRAFGAYGLPLSVLIDPEGHQVARAFGPAEWDNPSALDYFRALPAQAAS